MIFKHGIHCVLNILLILRELSGHLLIVLLSKSFDDYVGIGNLISIYLHKGKHPLSWPELALVIDILVLNPVKLQPRLKLETNRRDGRVLGERVNGNGNRYTMPFSQSLTSVGFFGFIASFLGSSSFFSSWFGCWNIETYVIAYFWNKNWHLISKVEG